MTDVLPLDAAAPDPASIAVAAARIRAGELVAFPTETVYGLGAHALDATAVARIFAAKGRPADDPLIVHVTGPEGVAALVASVPPVVDVLAARFWPGPLTLVLPRGPRVPTLVTAGLDTVAVRVPAHPVARALLAAAGVPVAAPSANLFSRPSPTTAAHVLEDLDGLIDLVLDAGATTIGLESTVVDLATPRPRVLRQGAVSVEALAPWLPNLDVTAPTAATGPMASPGLLPRHYAPRTPLSLYTGPAALARLRADAVASCAAGRTVGVLATDEARAHLADLPLVIETMGRANDAAGLATRLYDALRTLDRGRPDVILACDIEGDGDLRPALRDRLRRAADGRVVAT
jgi:L-threonylcarbamoyladenylate synthase